MNWRDRITVDPNVMGGKPVVKGTRITVEFVLERLALGWSSEQLLKEYDHLTLDDTRACLEFAVDALKS